MKTVIHKSGTRGYGSYGWLETHHTFSFSEYHNPERMNFGVLRVLNDDKVIGGKGFGTHPHSNMEIVSIPLSGALEHKDSEGNQGVIRKGDIQVMSAGIGVFHSEFNHDAEKEVEFLQIWLTPKEQNVASRYDQKSLKDLEKQSEFYQILSPNKDDDGVWIHQDAYFSMGRFEGGEKATYQLKNPENGLYVFVIYGGLLIEGTKLKQRDGIGIEGKDEIQFEFKAHSHVLLMEVPMK